jgi:hypothetical protein
MEWTNKTLNKNRKTAKPEASKLPAPIEEAKSGESSKVPTLAEATKTHAEALIKLKSGEMTQDKFLPIRAEFVKAQQREGVAAEKPKNAAEVKATIKKKKEKPYEKQFPKDTPMRYAMDAIRRDGLRSEMGFTKDAKNKPKQVQLIAGHSFEDTKDLKARLHELGVSQLSHGNIKQSGKLTLDKLAQEMNDANIGFKGDAEDLFNMLNGQKGIEKSINDLEYEHAVEMEREYYEARKQFEENKIDPGELSESKDDLKAETLKEIADDEGIGSSKEELTALGEDADFLFGTLAKPKPTPKGDFPTGELEGMSKRETEDILTNPTTEWSKGLSKQEIVKNQELFSNPEELKKTTESYSSMSGDDKVKTAEDILKNDKITEEKGKTTREFCNGGK